jgi:aarF domain-containing kinase
MRNFGGTGGVMGSGLLNPSRALGRCPRYSTSIGLRAPGNLIGGWLCRHKFLQCGVGEARFELLRDLRQLVKLTGADLRAFRFEGLSRSHRYYSGTHQSVRKWVAAASLACARSQVVPRIIAVVVGEATLAHQSAASVESPLPVRIEWEQPHHPLSFALSLFEFLILVIRAAYLALLFTPAVVLAPFADSFDSKFRKRWISLVHFSLESAGAAFIKWGQWAAARPDLFPRDLCAQLSKLHSKAPAHKYSQTKHIIEGAFGRKVEEIFEDFEEEPVASGSIAQIHRAVLRYRYPGQMSKPMVVAVKVRHPGVSEIIRRDFTIINWCAKISNFLPGLSWLRLDESIGQFAVFMLTQVCSLCC